MLIKDCLAEAVPCSRAQLEEYEEVKRDTEKFQNFLTSVGKFWMNKTIIYDFILINYVYMCVLVFLIILKSSWWLLIISGLYGPDEKSIIEYAANVDVVFSNKACAHLLERARELMTRPVHVTVSVTPLEPDGPLIIQASVLL